MGKAKGITTKLVIYQVKKSGILFLRPTKCKNGRFAIKNHKGKVGQVLQKSVSDAELGKAIKNQFIHCE